jgi:hypothetical protein
VLPGRIYIYPLQRRLVQGAVQGPYDEALERVVDSTGTQVSKRSAEGVVLDCAQDFEAFYEQRSTPVTLETGPIVVAAVDCKGAPMVKPEEALRIVRRGKGEKANKKRMATVAAVFTRQPRVRTPEEVVESLFREGRAPAPRGLPLERPFFLLWTGRERAFWGCSAPPPSPLLEATESPFLLALRSRPAP